ncbi:unnamed protein product [Candidula unifasciata]|uniref:Uncharacterized protein n=1 Tax=Candidula unifasciata TaxID=100452 RepID=A0A8S3YIK7_9EUPU|nr:unnamed protein product [Candidula unifasciata]
MYFYIPVQNFVNFLVLQISYKIICSTSQFNILFIFWYYKFHTRSFALVLYPSLTFCSFSGTTDFIQDNLFSVIQHPSLTLCSFSCTTDFIQDNLFSVVLYPS